MDKGVDMAQVEFKGEASIKSGCRFTERGVEIYDEAKGEWEPIASAYEWVNKRTRPAKPKNKTMKYRTIVHFHNIPKGVEIEADSGVYAHNIIYDIHNDKWKANPSFLRNNDHLFEPVEQVQEGQYWEDDYGNIGRVQVVYESDVEIKSIDEEEVNTYDKSFFIDRARKLSTDEIEQALVREAKRRGFENENLPCKMKRNFAYGPIGGVGDIVEPRDLSEWQYNEREDLLEAGRHVYHKGVWNEIVDQTPTIEINGYEVELHDDCVKVGCEVLSPQFIKELNVILQKHGAEFIVSGNDISSQIRQIAKHYGNMAGEPVEFNDTFNVSGMGFSATNMWKAND